MAASNVMKEIEVNAPGISITKLMGAEAQNIDVSYDNSGNIIEDISIISPSSVSPLSTILKQGQTNINWAEENFLGAKNFIPYHYGWNTVNHGITYSIDTDGTITISGRVTELESEYLIQLPNTINEECKFSISCSNFNVGGTGVKISLQSSNKTNIVWFGSNGETDGTKDILVPENSDIQYFCINITYNATINLVIKPMLRLSSIKDNTYVPYAMTNKELTDKLTIINEWNLNSSDWQSNSDSATNTDYPYIYQISTTKYSFYDIPIWDLSGVGTLPTSTERENIDFILEAIFSDTGIILYAKDLPTVNLKLRVKG